MVRRRSCIKSILRMSSVHPKWSILGPFLNAALRNCPTVTVDQKMYEIQGLQLIADMPARSAISGFINFNGKSSCPTCTTEGVVFKKTYVLRSKLILV